MIWSIADLRAEKMYCLELRQDSQGERQIILVEAESALGPGAFDRTEVVDFGMLHRRNLFAIAKSVKLLSGNVFFVDPHGIWLTSGESEQLKRGVDLLNVIWDTALPPRFPSR